MNSFPAWAEPITVVIGQDKTIDAGNYYYTKTSIIPGNTKPTVIDASTDGKNATTTVNATAFDQFGGAGAFVGVQLAFQPGVHGEVSQEAEFSVTVDYSCSLYPTSTYGGGGTATFEICLPFEEDRLQANGQSSVSKTRVIKFNKVLSTTGDNTFTFFHLWSQAVGFFNAQAMATVQKIEIKFINQAPNIGVSLPSLSNSCLQGQNAPSQIVEVWNSGQGLLTYDIDNNVTWLNCTPTTGSSNGERDSIIVSYDTSGLAAGLYVANISFSGPGAGNSPVNIPVTLSVNEAPAIEVTPTSLNNTCAKGKNAASQMFQVRNAGMGTLNYTISDNVTWLSCSPDWGSSIGECNNINVNYNCSKLLAGSYEAIITISADGASNSLTIPVRLTVTDTPAVAVYPPAIFNSCLVGTNASSQTFEVWNSGSGKLSYTIADNVSWLSCSPSIGVSINQHNLISINYNSSSLPVGFYAASIMISDGVNTPTIIPVSLTVRQSSGYIPISLNAALDNNILNFTTGGNANWFAQTATSHYGGSAARSGIIYDNQSSWLKTTLTGPGTLSFYWKVSSEQNLDSLQIYKNGTLIDLISSNIDWQQKSYNFPSGSYTIIWNYKKNANGAAGSDCGWLDKVVWTPQIMPVVKESSSMQHAIGLLLMD
jgi:hypothetical protein